MVSVNRFVGKTAREALAQVKAELGPDAVVLSNRAVAGGVEIVAIPAEQMGELTATVRQAREPAPVAAPAPAPVPAPQARPAAARDDEDFTVTLGQHLARHAEKPALSARRPARGQFDPGMPERTLDEALGTQAQVRPFTPPRVQENGEPWPPAQKPVVRSAPRAERAAEPAQTAQIAALEASNARMAEELGSIKGLLERQLAGFAWSQISREEPLRPQMMGELLENGFSAALARTLTEALDPALEPAEARMTVKKRLAAQIRLGDSDVDILDRGGVFAVVGPTGVGKTTTVAKLAARCVVRHGASKLALITTDGYRIGAHEQLRIYGRILGVPVHVVRDAADLRQTLQDLRTKHTVLIDTVGMSQRDRMVLEQSSMLTAAGCVRRLLVLNATVGGATLEDVVSAYDGPDLAGCILSKVDESSSLGPAIDVMVRRQLQLFYLTNGQRVPEDLHMPKRSYLVHRALRERPEASAFKLENDEACLLMAHQGGSQVQAKGMRT